MVDPGKCLMVFRETIRSLAGGMAVYVAMASCSQARDADAPPGLDAAIGTSGSSGRTASGGSPGQRGGSGGRASIIDAALDQLTNPVTDAHADTNQSGTRLRAKYFVGSDGSRQFNGWHDSQRNEDCSFGTASDGMTRCLPRGATTGAYFADSGCSQVLAYVPKAGCTPPGPYALSYVTTCPGGSKVLSLGPAITTGNVYVGSPGSCIGQPISAALSGLYDFYSTGGEVAPSGFVAGTEQIE